MRGPWCRCQNPFQEDRVSPCVWARRSGAWLIAGAFTLFGAATSGAQDDVIVPIDISVGRSLPISLPASVTKVSIANPDVADIVVISVGELVINARAPGETDAIVWEDNGGRRHYRVI